MKRSAAYLLSALCSIPGVALAGGTMVISSGGSGKMTVVQGLAGIYGTTNTWTAQNVFTGSTSIKGTGTNNNAAAGIVGEHISSAVEAVAAAASGDYKDVTSISLTAGDWDVTGILMLYSNGATVTGSVTITVDVNDHTSFAWNYGNGTVYVPPPTASTGSSSGTVACYRISLATTTTVYLIGGSTYSGGTPNWYGRLSARRVR